MAWLTLEQSLLIGLGIASIIAGLASWIGFSLRHPILVLPPQHCRATPWGAGMCLLAFAILWLPQSRMAAWFGIGAVDFRGRVTTTLQASLLVFPIQFLLCLAIRDLVIKSRASWAWERSGRIVVFFALGWAAWLAATPMLLGLQFVVRSLTKMLTDTPQAENALITILRIHHDDARLWWLITAEAVFIAPLREELFFRGWVQPWLARRPWGGVVGVGVSLAVPIVMFESVLTPAKMVQCGAFVLAAAALAWIIRPVIRGWSHRWPRLFPPLAHGSNMTSKQVYYGIVGTSILFAVFHTPSWPDPIPLFPLGIILGWLAWRTQSLIASVICHAAFNATSLILLRLLPGIGV